MEEKERYGYGECGIKELYFDNETHMTIDVLETLNRQYKRIKELEEENKQLKQSQKQLAIEELKKLSKHFVYSGDEMISDYDLDCYPSELKEEIERRIRSLKRRKNE